MPESDIVVTARRIPLDFDFGWTFSERGGSLPPGMGLFYDARSIGDDPLPAPPPVDGSFQPPPGISAEDGQQIDPALNQRFQNSINHVHYKLANASGSLAIATNNNQIISIDEFYNNNLNLNFRITFTVNYRPGFGGEVKNTPSGFLSSMKNETLVGYDLLKAPGLNYLALHELAHTTNASTQFLAQKYDEHLRQGGTDVGWPGSALFVETEKYANDIARDFAVALGVEIIANPTHGY